MSHGRPAALALAIAAAVTTVTLAVTVAPAAFAAPADDPSTCTPSGSIPGGPVLGGSNASVYVGGDFTATSGAELEGNLVVDGNATFATGRHYNVGWVGSGSGLTPPAGSDVLRVGGDLAITSSQVQVQGLGGDGSPHPADVLVGGVLSGAANLAAGTVRDGLGHDAALGGFAGWPQPAAGGRGSFQLLHEIATRNLTGSAGTSSEQYGTLTITGSATAPRDSAGRARHLVTIPESEFAAASATSGGFVLDLGANIGPHDIVVIDATGSAPAVSVQQIEVGGVAVQPSSPGFGSLVERILWVFPDAGAVTIGGPTSGQFPGSVLVTNPASTTTMASSGFDGRIWVAGNLIHDKDSSEFHVFPFVGDQDMQCTVPPTTSTTTTSSSTTGTSTTGTSTTATPTIETSTSTVTTVSVLPTSDAAGSTPPSSGLPASTSSAATPGTTVRTGGPAAGTPSSSTPSSSTVVTPAASTRLAQTGSDSRGAALLGLLLLAGGTLLLSAQRLVRRRPRRH